MTREFLTVTALLHGVEVTSVHNRTYIYLLMYKTRQFAGILCSDGLRLLSGVSGIGARTLKTTRTKTNKISTVVSGLNAHK